MRTHSLIFLNALWVIGLLHAADYLPTYEEAAAPPAYTSTTVSALDPNDTAIGRSALVANTQSSPSYRLGSYEDLRIFAQLKSAISHDLEHINTIESMGMVAGTITGMAAYKSVLVVNPIPILLSAGLWLAIPWILDNTTCVRLAMQHRTPSAVSSLYAYGRFGVPVTKLQAAAYLLDIIDQQKSIDTNLALGYIDLVHGPETLCERYELLERQHKHIAALPALLDQLAPYLDSKHIAPTNAYVAAITYKASLLKYINQIRSDEILGNIATTYRTRKAIFTPSLITRANEMWQRASIATWQLFEPVPLE